MDAARDSSRPRPVALVIDDELGVRESFRLILDGEFEVLEAEQGIDGLEVLRGRRIRRVGIEGSVPSPSGLPYTALRSLADSLGADPDVAFVAPPTQTFVMLVAAIALPVGEPSVSVTVPSPSQAPSS